MMGLVKCISYIQIVAIYFWVSMFNFFFGVVDVKFQGSTPKNVGSLSKEGMKSESMEF